MFYAQKLIRMDKWKNSFKNLKSREDVFKVAITSFVLRKIEEHTNKPYEQIGFLVGELTGEGLLIRNAICGEGDANGSCSIFATESIARIADDIVNGRINGKIVGWYHSHVGAGVFMSETDVQTQLRLQQFSPYVVSLVIDTVSKQFGVYSYDPQQGLVQIPEDLIQII
jgi:proteasome lid subunit RPN8/RPN11